DQPIILAVEADNPNRANVRFLVDNAPLPADSDSYQRMVLVFNGDDPDALAAARLAWTECKSRGFTVTYWQADEYGRWQRRDSDSKKLMITSHLGVGPRGQPRWGRKGGGGEPARGGPGDNFIVGGGRHFFEKAKKLLAFL